MVSKVVPPGDDYRAKAMLDRIVNPERLLDWLEQEQVLPDVVSMEADSLVEEPFSRACATQFRPCRAGTCCAYSGAS